MPPPTKRSREDDPEPITADGEMPQKRFYRSRAHCNPLSFNENFVYPTRPDLFDWTEDHYPNHPLLQKNNSDHKEKQQTDDDDVVASYRNASAVRPNILDVGCGFGGLTLALSSLLPVQNNTILGLEIRTKVTEYVRLRILAVRNDRQYQNCSVLRTNAMKYLVHYFPRGSLDKIFFCFPDPHFKKKNHPRRIVSERLLSEYCYLLRPGGRLYCITDVKDLHEWHLEKCGGHPLLVECTEKEMEEDPCVGVMKVETEEGKKVEREGRFGHEKYYMVYRRVEEEEERGSLGGVVAENFFEEGQFGVEVFDNEKKS